MTRKAILFVALLFPISGPARARPVLESIFHRLAPPRVPEAAARPATGSSAAESNFLDKDRLPRLPETLQQEIFHRGFERKMREEYLAQVKPAETVATDPTVKARYWEVSKWDQDKKAFTKWTMREILTGKLRKFIYYGGDRESFGMKFVVALHMLTGGDRPPNPGFPAAEPTEQQRLAMAHRRDLPKEVVSSPGEEPAPTPTRLHGRINVLDQSAVLVLRNRISNATVSGSPRDTLFDLDHDFRRSGIYAKVIYGIQAEFLSFNLNKKLTPNMQLELTRNEAIGSRSGAASTHRVAIAYSRDF